MDAIFPSHLSVWYKATKKAIWNASVRKSISGKRRSLLFYETPIWEFTLPMDNIYEWEVELIMGFINKMGGTYDTFYFIDPMNRQENLSLGTGTGQQTDFRLYRNFGYSDLYIEYPKYPQTYIDNLGYGLDGYITPDIAGYGITVPNMPDVYVNSVLQTDSYSLTTDGYVQFVTPPIFGYEVTASFNFCYKAAFSDETEHTINYYDGWENTLKIETVK